MEEEGYYQMGTIHRRKGISLAALTDEELEEKRLKKLKEEEDKIIDYSIIFSEKLGELNFPPRLKERPLTANPRLPSQNATNSTTATTTSKGNATTISNITTINSTDRLTSLPGNLTLDFVTTQKYFGDNARAHFFNRHRFLDHQSKIVVTDKEKALEKLYFENETNTTFETVPFGPLRNDDEDANRSMKDSKQMTSSSMKSTFRSRFRSMVTSSEDSYDNMLLTESIKRSGGEDYDLDEQEILFEEELMKSDGRQEEVYSTYHPRETMLTSNSMNLIAAADSLKVAPSSRNGNGIVTSSPEKLERPNTANPAGRIPPSTEATTKQDGHRDSIGTMNYTLISAQSSRKTIRKPPPPPSAAKTMKDIHRRKIEEMKILQRNIAAESAVLGKKKKEALTGRNSRIVKKQMNRKSKFHKSGSISPDIYSQIILEDLFTKFNIKEQSSDPTTSGGRRNSLQPFPHQHRHLEDESIGTVTTVQTLDLLISDHFQKGEELSRGEIHSPRTKFITSCMQQHLNPRASLVLRKNMSKRLELQHHGMGDALAVLLANCLRDLPFIESINIADNMLTDDGMGPIILAAVNIPTLTELNLSQNVIGSVSSEALHAYLVSPDCTLKKLVLNSADVDDFECSGFIDAVKQNRSLIELDLSANLIGKAENLNTVMPDIITGGEAIADLLRSPECNLTRLHLQWNMIRLDGAIDLASSVAINNTLVYLDLSFNSLSTEGGIVLGVSLLKNRTLQSLILTNNNIDSKACFTICAAVIENRGLKKVVLDGNPIGDQGMKALMLVPLLAGNRVTISAAKCNITIKDPKCWFNFDKLLRDYDLDMEDGFERAIAIILLHLVAGHQTYIFKKFDFEAKTKYHEKLKQLAKNPLPPVTPPKGKGKGKEGGGGSAGKGRSPSPPKEKPYIPKLRPIDLIQALSNDHVQYFDEKQKDILKSLEKIKNAASDIQNAIRLFQEVDEDGSGELEIDELGNLMSKMGLKLSEKRLQELMEKYDTDGGGSIQMSEFLMLLKSQKQEAVLRIKEMSESPIMVLRNDKKNRYIPPETGFLHISVIDGFARKKFYRVLTVSDRERIEAMSHEMGGNVTNVVKSSLENTKLRLDEALTLAETMMADSRDRVAIVKKLLLQMDRTDDSQHFLTSIIGGNRADMLRLKKDFGAAMRPLLGNPNGYYVLDMSKDMDRMCLERLLEISATDAQTRQENSKIGYGRIGDLSQKGNYSCFRNEMFNGQPITLTLSFVAPMPTSGKLEFDFSGGGRPSREVLVLSDQRIIKILRMHHLLDSKLSALAMFKLQEAKIQAQKTLGCNGNTYYECPMERARLIGEHIETFYLNNHLRMKMYEEALEHENATELDMHGQLINLFEKDKYAMPPSIADYYVRQELIQREREEKEAAERALKLEKERRMAERYAVYRGGSTVSHIHMPLRDPGDTDTGEDEDSSDSASEEVPSKEISQVLKQLVGDSDLDEEEEGDAAVVNDEEFQESQDWLKEFELLKEAMKKKEPPQKEAIVDAPRRKNFFQDEGFVASVVSDDFLEKFKIVLEAPNIQEANKAHRIIELLEDVFSRNWIYSRHLALILECFVQYGYYKQTKYFGTYRVELAIALFSRVVDLHNFEFVLEVLSPFEVACLICRLGYLNLYNPCKPEGSWELDLSRREERVLAKTLCVLATHEPGDNWTFQTFRWMRSMESMPGWQLTQPWLTEEGMPMRGLVNITYYSGEGKNKNGCKPYVSFRKSLLNMVLINEEEIVDEEMRGKPRPPILPGGRCFNKHFTLWDTYLAPAYVDPNRKR